ncbi:MAG: hypothetical protein EBR82_36915 [Caulobacteraceae bacterium]|nr:hypothetical protein [Caulobacteraceae bacterium]
MTRREDIASAAVLIASIILAAAGCAYALGYAAGASEPVRVVKIRSACDLADRDGLKAAWYELAVRHGQ